MSFTGIPFIFLSFISTRTDTQITKAGKVGKSMERELYQVSLRTDAEYVRNAVHLVQDMNGTVSYTNTANKDKVYGVVKGYIPKERIDVAKEDLRRAPYVWDAEIKVPDAEPYKLKRSQRLSLNQIDGKLHAEDRLVPEHASGYTIIVPSFKNPRIEQLYQEAKLRVAGRQNQIELVQILTDFIYKRIPYNDKIQDRMLHLDRALDYGGVCKEKAALLQMLLQRFGIESRFRRGYFEYLNKPGGRPWRTSKHAWVEVHIGNQNFVADPTKDLLATPEEIYKLQARFSSGSNIIERTFS